MTVDLRADSVSVRELRGRVEGLTGRVAHGWLFNIKRLYPQLQVAAVVDGITRKSVTADRYNDDLARAGFENGKFGFTLPLPRELFDDETHDVRLIELATGWELPNSPGNTVLRRSDSHSAVFEVSSFENGRVHGRAYDRADDALALSIELKDAEEVVAVATTANVDGDRIIASPVHGQVLLDLSQISINSLFSSRAYSLRVGDLENAMPILTQAIAKCFAVSFSHSDEDFVYLAISMGQNINQAMQVDILIDTRKYKQICLRPVDGKAEFVARIALDEVRNTRGIIAIRFAASDYDLPGSPCRFSDVFDRNVLLNSFFNKWQNDKPVGWDVRASRNVSFSSCQIDDSLLKPFRVGTNALMLSRAVQEEGEAFFSLAQSIPQTFVAETALDVALFLSASDCCTISITLEGAEGTIYSASSVDTDAFLRSYLVRLETDARLGDIIDAVLRVTGNLDRKNSVLISMIAAGRQGFSLNVIEDGSREIAIETNSVKNCNFDEWSSPLHKILIDKRTETARGWFMVLHQDNSRISTWAKEISGSALRSQREPTSIYGLALHGTIRGFPARLETELEMGELVKSLPNGLSMHVQPSVHSEPARISEIFLVVRKADTASISALDFNDSRLITIAKNINVPPLGECLTIKLDADRARSVYSAAKTALLELKTGILLVCLFRENINVFISRVKFGCIPESPVQHQDSAFFALEDINITAQNGLVKGIEHWRSSSEPRAAVRNLNTGSEVPYRHTWQWPSQEDVTSIDIVICVHNAIDESLECLVSLRRHTTIPHTITIVDDASDIGCRRQLRNAIGDAPWIRIIEVDQNIGYTRSAKLGFSQTNAEWVVLINSDAIVTRAWLEKLLRAARAKPRAGMVGPMSNAASWQSVPELRDDNGGWMVNPIPQGWTVDNVASLIDEVASRSYPEVPLLNGFCTLIRREAYDAAGGFDELSFPIGYGEENDLCVRVASAGYSLVIADDAYVYHAKSASFGSKRRAELAKIGTRTFLSKHPGINLKEIEKDLTENTDLTQLRKVLRSRLKSKSQLFG